MDPDIKTKIVSQCHTLSPDLLLSHILEQDNTRSALVEAGQDGAMCVLFPTVADFFLWWNHSMNEAENPTKKLNISYSYTLMAWDAKTRSKHLGEYVQPSEEDPFLLVLGLIRDQDEIETFGYWTTSAPVQLK
jgi:hypothetical protein